MGVYGGDRLREEGSNGMGGRIEVVLVRLEEGIMC